MQNNAQIQYNISINNFVIKLYFCSQLHMPKYHLVKYLV
jgi:hypothetical protein